MTRTSATATHAAGTVSDHAAEAGKAKSRGNRAALNSKPRNLWQTQQRCESQAAMQLVTLRLMNDLSGFPNGAKASSVISLQAPADPAPQALKKDQSVKI